MRTILLTLSFAFVMGFAAQAKTKICFVSHKGSHGRGAHEYAAGCQLMGKWLEAAYPGKIESAYSINWPADPDSFFDGADTVVIFCSGGGGHLVNRHVAEFDKLMRKGVGLACLHYAVEVPVGPSGKGMLNWMGGYFQTHWSVNPHWSAKFEVFPDHPAANGVKPFEVNDEWYFHMKFRGDMEGITPILSAVAPESTMKRGDGAHSGNPHVRKAVAAGEPQHVAWCYQRGDDYAKGRGFGFTGLHFHWNWEDDNFRKAVLNGVAWTAKLEIPEGGIYSPTPTREELQESIGMAAKPKAASFTSAKVKPLFRSGVITRDTPGHAKPVEVAIPAGAKQIYLAIDPAGEMSHDWADWAEPRFVMGDGSEQKLTDRKWKSGTTGWGRLEAGKSAGGGALKIAGEPVEYGIGAHAPSLIVYDVPPGAKAFKARGGLDNGATDQTGGKPSVEFLVFDKNPGG